MERLFSIIYNQNDYLDFLGTSIVNTIKGDGCFLCSGCTGLGYYGITITPPEMNKLLIQKSLYIDQDLLPDNWISLVYPQIKYLKTFDYEPIPTDLGNISTLLTDATVTLICRINLGSGNLHFVQIVACDPQAKTLHIANSLSGEVEDFSQHYGNPITAKLHILVYSGSLPIPVAPSPASQPDQTSMQPTPLAQRFTQAITKSSNFDLVATYLGLTPDQTVSTEGGKLVVTKFQFLQDEVVSLQHKLDAVPQPLPNVPMPTPPPPSSPLFSNGSAPIAGNETTIVTTTTPASVRESQQAKSPLKVNWLLSIIRTILF